MSYISKRILTKDELIMIKPEKNPIFLVLKWVLLAICSSGVEIKR